MSSIADIPEDFNSALHSEQMNFDIGPNPPSTFQLEGSNRSCEEGNSKLESAGASSNANAPLIQPTTVGSGTDSAPTSDICQTPSDEYQELFDYLAQQVAKLQIKEDSRRKSLRKRQEPQNVIQGGEQMAELHRHTDKDEVQEEFYDVTEGVNYDSAGPAPAPSADTEAVPLEDADNENQDSEEGWVHIQANKPGRKHDDWEIVY
ncbi:hypothetical protein QFC19_000633 [Naganishia cerealis]|uniref:Uncharacterized protein n=1 Tax=Naganishia cerealis TaxID=610337 RepID=A0ACC2WLJ7_9TREE|nr:hypothetical protein QFC19_000633 [Naganishia cerealis]